MTARILIADDHPVLRAGLRALLGGEPDYKVVGEAADSDEAVRMAGALQPDVVIMDIGMPGCGGIAATERLVGLHPHIRVLVLTASEETAMMHAALRAGAMGFVAKRVVESELVNAIHAVTHGDIYVHSSMTRESKRSTGSFGAGATDRQKRYASEWACVEPLTPRETEVLRYIGLGYTNPEIATELQISVRTVETHRENLIAKLNMHTRVELVRYALDQGLLEAGVTG